MTTLFDVDETIRYVEKQIEAASHLSPAATENARRQLKILKETRARYITAMGKQDPLIIPKAPGPSTTYGYLTRFFLRLKG